MPFIHAGISIAALENERQASRDGASVADGADATPMAPSPDDSAVGASASSDSVTEALPAHDEVFLLRRALDRTRIAESEAFVEVEQLPLDLQASQRTNRCSSTAHDECLALLTCVVCLDARRSFVTSCGHLCMGAACDARVRPWPVCRAHVRNPIVIMMP